MKSQGSFRTLLAFALTLAMAVNPVLVPKAMASQKDDFHRVCDPINNDENGGDQAKAECAKAEIAMNTSKVEKTKVTILTAAALICTVNAVLENLPWSSAAAKIICKGLSVATPLSTQLLESKGATTDASIVGKFAASSSQVMSYAGTAAAMIPGASNFLGGWAANMTGIGKTTKTIQTVNIQNNTHYNEATGKIDGNLKVTTENKDVANYSKADQARANNGKDVAKEKQEKKSTCMGSAIMLGIPAALSAVGLAGANKTFNVALSNAKNVSDTAKDSTTQMQLGFNANAGRVPTNPTRSATPKAAASETCDSQSGSQYLNCMSNLSPDVAAITSNPDFVGTMEKALGQNLGDFAKGFNGNTPQDAANYVGAAMGIPGGDVAKLMDVQKALAKDTGALDKYEPMAYVHSGGGASAGVAAPDFGSLMSNMLKQLDPNADSKKNEDPSALVFRQLDLLPPEKIVQSRDISLFARIGYRYRKHLDHLEHLNWAIPENQENARK